MITDSRGVARQPGLLGKVLGAIVGAIVLVIAFMFSVVALAVVSVIVLIVIGYLWWKTRDLRRRMRENPPGGRVIDGDAIQDRD
ncbi:MAG: hypothetical protein PVH25_06950 [Burkholderiales bacterium]